MAGLTLGGLLRDRLSVLGPTRAETAAGGHTTVWASCGVVAGAITAVSGRGQREQAAAGGVRQAPLYDVHLDALAVEARVQDRLQDEDGRVYTLVSLTRQGRYQVGVARELVG